MCDPVLAAGIALSAAGSAVNAKIQGNAAQAQVDQQNQAAEMAAEARREETKRQRALENQSHDEVRQAITDTAPQDRAELARAVAEAPDNQVQQAAADVAPLPRATNDRGEVIGFAGKLRDEATRSKSIIDAMALLSAQGVGNASASDRLSRMGAEIDSDTSQALRSARVADFEASVPVPTVRPSNSILGDLMIGGGQLASGFGGGNVTGNPFANWDLIGKKGAFNPGAVSG